MNYPSVLMLSELTGEQAHANKVKAKAIRKIIKTPWEPVTKLLERVEKQGLLGISTHGVERIDRGEGSKSPSILYLNTGDSYTQTLMYISGRGFRVGCWGDIVERGKYK